MRPDVTVEAEDEGAGLPLVAAEETHALLDAPLPRRRHLLHELRHKQKAACTQWLFVIVFGGSRTSSIIFAKFRLEFI